jgi:hypothetical protein
MKHGSITSIKNKKEHIVDASLLTPSEEIQEGAISAEKIMASIFWDNND